MTTITTTKQSKGFFGFLASALERYLDELGRTMAVHGGYVYESSKLDSASMDAANKENGDVSNKDMFWYGGGCCW